MRRTICVKGRSMEPTLVEGQYLSCNTSRKAIRNIITGDIIVFKHDGRFVIKRVTRIFKNAYFVIGDNTKHSFDSREYGSVSKKDVIGVVDMIDGKTLKLGSKKYGENKISFKSIYTAMCSRLGI